MTDNDGKKRLALLCLLAAAGGLAWTPIWRRSAGEPASPDGGVAAGPDAWEAIAGAPLPADGGPGGVGPSDAAAPDVARVSKAAAAPAVSVEMDRGKPVKPKPPAGSAAVYPPPVLAVTFDHSSHARRGIACERCHESATHSLSANDDLFPPERACRSCHAVDRAQPEKSDRPGQPPARCEACHPGLTGAAAATGMTLANPARLRARAPALKFNHKLHRDLGVECARCHAGVDKVREATATQMPRMSLCLACHDGKQATSRCSACHVTLPDGRLKTSFASGLLLPSGSLRGLDAHTPIFRTDHRIAGRDLGYCQTCHRQNECTACHGAGVIRPADFHPGDYATLHAVDARRNVPNCSTCHRNQTFCLGCHQRLGVAPDPEGGKPGIPPNNPFGTGTAVKRFHPPGWVRDEAGTVLTTPTPASHSFQARRNLRTCVSCHREESCLTCHSADPTRSMGINPHPAGFAGSSLCRSLSARNTRACLKCHAVGAPELSCH